MSILPLLNALICAILAIFVFFRNPKHPVNISFSSGLISLGLMELANFMALYKSPSPFWLGLARVAECLIPATWMTFIYTFEKRGQKILLNKLLALFYALSLFFVVSSQRFIRPLSDSLFSIEKIGYYFYLFLCLSMIFMLSKLEGVLRSSKGAVRWQIKYALLGLGSIFASFIFIAGQRLLYRTIDLNNIPIQSVIILISLFLIIFALVRRRFMDVQLSLSRYAVYNSLTIVFVGIYFLSLGLMGELAKKLGINLGYLWEVTIIFVSALFLLTIILSENMRQRVRYFIIRHFYKDKYDYRAQWLDFSRRLTNKFTTPEICEATLDLLSEAMYVKQLSIWTYNKGDKSLEMVSSRGLNKVDCKIENKGFISYLKERPFVFTEQLKRENNRLYQENKAFFKGTNACLCVSIAIRDDFLGIITIGHEMSNQEFIQDDFDLLTSVAAQASNALLNVKLSESLIQAKQQETFHRLSSFVIHDLKNLVYTLSLSLENAKEYFDNPEFKQDLLDTISHSVSKMKDIMAKLSSVPKEIEIHPQQIDLNNLIDEVLNNLKTNSRELNIKKSFQNKCIVEADKEQINKVITNLLLNAIEASGERGEITINTYSKNGWVTFSVSDNGPGMDEEFKKKYLFKPFCSTKKKGLGIGLFQCKTIIDAHKGKIEVESERGKGCTFKVKLPI